MLNKPTSVNDLWLPSAAWRICVVNPKCSSRSSLNHSDGEGVMERGWWKRDDVCPSCFWNFPRFTLSVISNIGNALQHFGSTCLPKKQSEQMATIWENTHYYAVDSGDSKHQGRNVQRAASSLNRDLFQAGCKRAVGLLQGAEEGVEMPAAEIQNALQPGYEFYCQRETRAQTWNLRESKDWEK